MIGTNMAISLDKRRSSEDEQQLLVQQAFSSLDVGVLQELNAKAKLEVFVENCLHDHYAAKAAEVRAQRINAITQVLEGLDSEHVVSFVQSLDNSGV
jgi:hypothetical protein